VSAQATGPFDFRGQRALVTGGTRGIGGAIARRLASCGAHVTLNYLHNEEAARKTAGEIERAGGSATLAQANMVDPDAIAALTARVAAEGLDILVHNAALGSFKPLHKVKANQWDLTLNVNARALLLLAQGTLAALESRRGRIVSISSLGSTRVLPSYGAIGVSKAALETTTRYLASELGPRGIRVNGVVGGLIDTEASRLHPDYDTLAEAALAQTPLGRLATIDDIADAVLFLCSPLSAGIVGQMLVVDGGSVL
jgi:enoyl-[acyl-carrier protein] reductase III